MRTHFLSTLSAIALSWTSLPAVSTAQIDDEEQYDQIIVTGSRLQVTQGGAQDVKFFRTRVMEDNVIPAPGAITSEGLLSEHNLIIGNQDSCDQLFCITTEAMRTDMISRPGQDAFMGIGFATNLTTETWERDPLTIIAVVDVSGSMGGEPLALVQKTLSMVTTQLRPGDRIGIVEYGSEARIFMKVADVTEDNNPIFDRIAELDSWGSTNMEEGLELGFDTAYDAQKGFEGTTRIILFTDEQPNVGDTDDASFIGMARKGSERGVGMTTIGVASHFGADLANKLSAARGGNLFYINDEADIAGQFGIDFELAMTELAQDLELVIKPAKGMKISDVYGVPGKELNYSSNGRVSLTVPSVFLSSKGGGIFIGFEGEVSPDSALAEVSIRYTETKSGKTGKDKQTAYLSPKAGEGLMKAQLLSDQFGVMQSVAETSMFGGDFGAAINLANAMEARLIAQNDESLSGEIELMESLVDLLEEQAETGEPGSKIANGSCDYCVLVLPDELSGNWQVVRVRNRAKGLEARKQDINIDAGDMIAFHRDTADYDETLMFNLKRVSPDYGDPAFEIESMEVDENRKTVELFESEIVFDYQLRDDNLILKPQGSDISLYLKRPAAP